MSGWCVDGKYPTEDKEKTINTSVDNNKTSDVRDASHDDITKSNNTSALSRSLEPRSPSVGDADSPGNLQIDLAVSRSLDCNFYFSSYISIFDTSYLSEPCALDSLLKPQGPHCAMVTIFSIPLLVE